MPPQSREVKISHTSEENLIYVKKQNNCQMKKALNFMVSITSILMIHRKNHSIQMTWSDANKKIGFTRRGQTPGNIKYTQTNAIY